MTRKKSVLFLCIVITFSLTFCLNSDATSVTKEGLRIEFDKGKLSVDIKDIDIKVVFKALEEKGKIEIVNQRILPDRKVSLKFKDLKVKEGLKKLMGVAGISNHLAVYKRGSKPDETVMTKLVLIKAEPPGPEMPEVKKKEAKVTLPVEKKREDLAKGMDKGQAETIMEAIMPMLEDEETAREIMKELMEGETHPIDD